MDRDWPIGPGARDRRRRREADRAESPLVVSSETCWFYRMLVRASLSIYPVLVDRDARLTRSQLYKNFSDQSGWAQWTLLSRLGPMFRARF